MRAPNAIPDTRIISRDFERFTSEVTAQIWNQIVNHPHFQTLRPTDFAELFEAVSRTLREYRASGRTDNFPYMKITQRLVGDHLTFRKMLSDLNMMADTPAVQRDTPKLIRLVELFKDHLALHAWCEDTFYYLPVRNVVEKTPFGPLNRLYMDHLDEEHKTVDGYLDRLEQNVKGQPPVPTWPQTYALFSKGLLAHMKKEEEELFPLSEKLLGAAALETFSQELEKRRGEAPRARLHSRS